MWVLLHITSGRAIIQGKLKQSRERAHIWVVSALRFCNFHLITIQIIDIRSNQNIKAPYTASQLPTANKAPKSAPIYSIFWSMNDLKDLNFKYKWIHFLFEMTYKRKGYLPGRVWDSLSEDIHRGKTSKGHPLLSYLSLPALVGTEGTGQPVDRTFL